MKARIILNVKSTFKSAFGKYLLATNVVSSGILMGVGDSVEQILELRRNDHPKGYFDWPRIGHMTLVGFLIGYPQHYFYHYMDLHLPGTKKQTVLKKILLDQFIASPASIALFFYGLGVIENKSLSVGHEEFKSKFTTVYMMDWLFWPPTQFINFFFLSPKYRVVYVNGMTMLYDVFLSYIKFIHSPDEKTAPNNN